MQRRAYERVTSNIAARFYGESGEYAGTVTNLSENGMFVCAESICFPFDFEFKMVFPIQTEVLNIPVKVCRITKTEGNYDGIGVQLLDQPQNYKEFVSGLRTSR